MGKGAAIYLALALSDYVLYRGILTWVAGVAGEGMDIAIYTSDNVFLTGGSASDLRNGNSATIDISIVAKGIYFVEIKTEKEVERKKIVKE